MAVRTWVASSRVGSRIRPRGALGRLVRPASRTRTGRPKARVLPEPVRARPSTWRPASASGITACWTGLGLTISWRANADTSEAGRSRVEKVGSTELPSGLLLTEQYSQTIRDECPISISRGFALLRRAGTAPDWRVHVFTF